MLAHTAFGPADQASLPLPGPPLPPGLLVAPAQGQGLTRRFASCEAKANGRLEAGGQVSGDATPFWISRTCTFLHCHREIVSSDLPSLGMPDQLPISR